MENNQLSSRVEAYFATLEAPLSELPARCREEFMAEARAHLHAMVEARRADGLDEAAAWNAALSEFGEPGEVGRALWKSWATSGQLESEGEPLSKRQLAKKFVKPLIAVSIYYLLTTLLLSSDRVPKVPFFLLLGVLAFGIGIFRARRAGMQWTPSSITGAVLMVVQLLLSLAQLQWEETRYGTLFMSWGTPLLLFCYTFWWWLYKRDLRKRPWKSSALYSKNSVAAEQSYRISPLIGWTMGSVMGCMGTFAVFLQILGWMPTLLLCAANIVTSVVGGFWLYRRK